jgi:hypothetical protein
MRDVIRTSTLSLLAIMVCLPASQAAQARPIFGFNDTPETFAARAKAVKHARATMARIPVSWERAEPRPGKYDWSWLDGAVSALRSRGIRPLFVLSAAPTWAAPGCNRSVTATCAVGEGYEANYVRLALQLLNRYRGSQVQSWNEPNIPAFGALPPQRVGELTEMLYQVAPRKVIGPAASPGPPDAAQYTAVAYDQVSRRVPMAFNFYPDSVYGHGARSLSRDWRRARALAGRRHVWVTEIGFPAIVFGEAGQARNTARAYRLLARRGADAIIVHCLQDPVGADNEWLATLGLLRADGRRKPAYRALRRAAASAR